ncbi:hypothetical protein VE02_10380 [Pseudogymnoascus sp. 03VT05]|nr:hypothetical protein VE02_10380 [Pseudogymnoascus sp. 03VT05]
MPVPVPSRALADSFCVFYYTSQHSPCVPVGFLLLFSFTFRPEFAALVAAKAATPLLNANVVAAAVKANCVLLLATASVPKFRSKAERDLYKEARAT